LALADRVVSVIGIAAFVIDEHRHWIVKKFPTWGPKLVWIAKVANTAASIYGIGRLAAAGYKLVKDLRRASKGLREEAALVEKLSDTEKQVIRRLDDETDDLIKLLDNEAAAAKTAAGSTTINKTKVIEEAISEQNFSGEFSALANHELQTNMKNMRPSRTPGYSVEVPIEGTDHFLARKPNGTWCLFSGQAIGCDVIKIPKDTDEVFAQITKELGLEPPKLGKQGKVDIDSVVNEAKKQGLVGPAGEPIAVDLVVQMHSSATETRKALGVKGKDIQSAHGVPTSALKDVPGYSRERALTVLLPRDTHKAFDDFWKEWSIAQRKKGITHATVDEFLEIMDKAIEQTPNLADKTKKAMAGNLFNEFYKELEMKPWDKIELPYPNVKPEVP
jgi:hypothetical protein